MNFHTQEKNCYRHNFHMYPLYKCSYPFTILLKQRKLSWTKELEKIKTLSLYEQFRATNFVNLIFFSFSLVNIFFLLMRSLQCDREFVCIYVLGDIHITASSSSFVFQHIIEGLNVVNVFETFYCLKKWIWREYMCLPT